jgi:hypothetical protein
VRARVCDRAESKMFSIRREYNLGAISLSYTPFRQQVA